MNSEVLRRKMFNTVLRDANQPAGILASSSELAGAVQKRNNGGANFMGGKGSQTVGNAFARARGIRVPGNTSGAGMPEGTESYLQVLARIKDLPYNQQVAELERAGFAAKIGPDLKSEIQSVASGIAAAARPTERISALGDALSEAGEALAPDPITPAEARRQAKPSVSGMPGGPAPVPETSTSAAMPADDLSTRTPVGIQQLMDEAVAAQAAGQDVDYSNVQKTPQNVILGEYGTVPEAPGPTVAETVSETAVSGPDTQTTAVPRPVTSETQAVDLDPENKLSNFSTQLDTATNKSDVTKINAPKIKAEDFVGKQEQVGESWTKYIDKSFTPSERVTFSDMEDRAKQLMDFDPEAGDKQRKSAFFMNLMKAGLAIAAGESDNLVTNLAKGLGIGLEGYGEDLNKISAEEREQRKEYRATVRQMVNDENDYRVAMDGLKAQHQSSIARLAQAEENAVRSRNLQRETAALGAATTEAQLGLQAEVANARNELAATSNALQLKGLELNFFKAMGDLNYKEAALTEQQRNNAATEAISMYKAELSAMPKEQLQVMAMGKDYILLNDDGSFKGFTEQGETLYKNLITASTRTKSSMTDLMQTANGHAINGNILGVALSTEPTLAQSQALVWESTFNDPYSKALEDGNTELAQQVLSDFASSIGGQVQAQDQSQVAGSDIPRVTNKEEYDNLPSGTEFIQNGQRRRKP